MVSVRADLPGVEDGCNVACSMGGVFLPVWMRGVAHGA